MDTSYFTSALDTATQCSAEKAERAAAESYLMALQSSAEGLNICFHILFNEPIVACRFFWAANTFLHHLPQLATSLDVETVESVYRTLSSSVWRYLTATQQQQQSLSSSSTTSSSSDAIMNKHAYLMVAGFQAFLPRGLWSSLLEDLLRMRARAAQQSEGMMDAITMYILRVLEYVDERVVSVRDQADRGREQREVDMLVKDVMRETVMPELVEVWWDVLSKAQGAPSSNAGALQGQQRQQPVKAEIIRLCLGVVRWYAEWIDVNLLVQDRWISLLYGFLTNPAYRVGVCECLLALLMKKQVPTLKLETLTKLRVVQEIQSWVLLLEFEWRASENAAAAAQSGGGGGGAVGLYPLEDEYLLEENAVMTFRAFADAAIALMTAVASQLLLLVDAFRNNTTNLTNGEQQQGEVESLLAALHAVVGVLLWLLAHLQATVPLDEVLLFFQNFVKTPYVTQGEAASLLGPLFFRTQRCTTAAIQRALDATGGSTGGVGAVSASGMAIGGAGGGGAGANNPSAEAGGFTGMEIEERGAEERKAAFHVVRLLFRSYPDVVWEHIFAVMTASAAPEADAAYLEAALRYVYEMGGCVKLDLLKQSTHPLTVLVERIVMVGSQFFLREADELAGVHLMFFETLARYAVFFVYFPTTHLPVALEQFLLHPCGVPHPHPRIRRRIRALFRVFTVALCSSPQQGPLLPHAMTIHAALLSTIRTSLSSPSAAAAAALVEASSSAGGGGSSGDAEGVRELLEAGGQLISLWALFGSSGGGDAAAQGGEEAAMEEAIAALQCTLEAIHSSRVPTTSSISTSSIECCAALIRGIQQGYTGAPRESPRTVRWQEMVELQLSPVLHVVVASIQTSGGGGWSVEAISQLFGQLLHAMPSFERQLAGPLEQFIVVSLTMNCGSGVISDGGQPLQPSDAIRLLRLLQCVVGTVGRRAEPLLAAVLPITLPSIERCVGLLPMASASTGIPMLEARMAAPPATSTVFNARSEESRECVEVYRWLLTFFTHAVNAGCGQTILCLSPSMLSFLFAAIQAAQGLPTEMEIGRSSLQLCHRLSQELPQLRAQGGAAAVEACAYWSSWLLHVLLPTVLAVCTAPRFEWTDAKAVLYVNELAAFLHGMTRIYPEEDVRAVLLASADATGSVGEQLYQVETHAARVSPGFKAGLRSVLQQQQQQQQQQV